MIDFELKWSCRYCGKYHKNWVEVIDIPLSQKMNVKCKNCKIEKPKNSNERCVNYIYNYIR